MATDTPIVIQESRWKAAGLAFGGAVFVWGGSLMLKDPKASHEVAWFSILFFGACGLLGLAQIFRPSTLTLAPSGFTVRQVTRTWSARWDQVDNFRIWQMRMSRYVQFDYVGERPQWGGFGRSGMLPGNWTMSPPKLLELMKDCKARWGVGASPAREPTVS